LWYLNSRTFENFTKLRKNPELLEKFKLLDRRGFQLLATREEIASCPPAKPHS